MKVTVKSLGIIFLSIIALAICMTMYGREVRNKELQNNVHNVAEQTVSVACATKEYKIPGQKEFVADFVQNLSMNMITDSDVTVQLYGADKDKGVLSVNIIEDYKHPTGADGKVEHNRTVIFDKKVEVQETHEVNFYLNASDVEPYMAFTVYTGDMIGTPLEPQMADRSFVGWQDINGYLADFTQPIEQDITYYAVWN